MTNRERAYTIAGAFFHPSHPSYLPLADLVERAQEQALAAERATWPPAIVGVDLAVPGSERTHYAILPGGRLVPLGEANAAYHPSPATVQRGYTTMFVCPRCGNANVGTFCSMCCAPFDYAPTEDSHGTTEP